MLKVIAMGRMARDLEIRYTASGACVGDGTIVSSEKWKSESGEAKEHVSFVDFTVWGKTAETVAEHFKKGDGILIEGKLRQESWEDRESGQKRSKIKILLERFEFPLGKKRGSDQDGGSVSQTSSGRTRKIHAEDIPRVNPTAQSEPVADEDDIPF